MKILFVAPRFPLPANTGAKIRTYNLLKQVAKGNEVILITFSFKGINSRIHIKSLEKQGIKVHLVKAEENINPFTIFSDKPISIEKYRSKDMRNILRNLTTNENFDLIHFDHLHMVQYRDCINGKPCILDDHNVESILLNRCADMTNNRFKQLLFKSQARKMVDLEVKLVNRVTKCLVVSDNDKNNLSSLLGQSNDIEVIPNGVDTEYFRSSGHHATSLPEENAIVFTGSMDWLPNTDAAEYFCKDILPLIRKIKKEVKFYIVGKNPSKKVIELGKQNKGIIVTGEVEDVRPYIENAEVFVVPMRIGGGTRLKILEAMSMQKAVVSTSLGAEGIDYTEDSNILLADSPQIFANKVISLLEDSGRAVEIGLNGRRLVRDKYDWNIVGDKLNRTYKEVLNVGQ
ncbi:MAG: glycosyltransferase [Candidatus Omnitrophica bacterium]|nr:glycosyltransferase [Candidatus Omnitrophota bacterium]